MGAEAPWLTSGYHPTLPSIASRFRMCGSVGQKGRGQTTEPSGRVIHPLWSLVPSLSGEQLCDLRFCHPVNFHCEWWKEKVGEGLERKIMDLALRMTDSLISFILFSFDCLPSLSFWNSVTLLGVPQGSHQVVLILLLIPLGSPGELLIKYCFPLCCVSKSFLPRAVTPYTFKWLLVLATNPPNISLSGYWFFIHMHCQIPWTGRPHPPLCSYLF